MPSMKKPLGGILAAMAVGCGHEFLVLGGKHPSEQIGPYIAQRAAMPDVEEVGEIGVADVVVVGRICRDDGIVHKARFAGGVLLNDRGPVSACICGVQKFGHPTCEVRPIAVKVREWIGLWIVPRHWECLARE